MTREAAGTVSVPRDNARSERVCGGVSAAIEKGLVYAAAILTFAVLLFLIGYILVTGIPHLTPSLFSPHYTSENVSMIPAIVTTVETSSPGATNTRYDTSTPPSLTGASIRAASPTARPSR